MISTPARWSGTQSKSEFKSCFPGTITSNKPVDAVKLNGREIEFLKLSGTELTYKEIADQMCISVRTVDGYRDQLLKNCK